MLEWAHNCGKKPPLSSVSSPHCRQWCSRLHALCSAPPPTLARRILSPWVQFMIQFRHWNTQIFLHTFLQSSKLEMKDSSSTAPAAPPIGGEKCWENNIIHTDTDKSGHELFQCGSKLPFTNRGRKYKDAKSWTTDLCLNASHLELFSPHFPPFFPQLHSS